MFKKSASVFTIVYKSFKTFFDNIPQFLLYMFYPLSGQLFGIILIFLPFLLAKSPENVFLPSFVICFPAGICLFCHAFWRFLLISGGLVLISRDFIENNTVREFKHYTELFKKRTKDYIIFLLITSFVIPLILLMFIFLAVIVCIMAGYSDITVSMDTARSIGSLIGLITGLIALVFYAVSLQSFTLNQNLTPLKSILKGARLILRYFFPTIGLFILILLIVFIWGEIVGYALSATVFTPSWYEGYSAYPSIEGINMPRLIDIFTSSVFLYILYPFMIFAPTWWYLRMDKECALKEAKKH